MCVFSFIRDPVFSLLSVFLTWVSSIVSCVCWRQVKNPDFHFASQPCRGADWGNNKLQEDLRSVSLSLRGRGDGAVRGLSPKASKEMKTWLQSRELLLQSEVENKTYSLSADCEPVSLFVCLFGVKTEVI